MQVSVGPWSDLVRPSAMAWCDAPPSPCPLLQVFNGSREMPYNNPRGPVHIITGSAVSRAGKGAAGFSPLAIN